jgi:hypothetical protein
MVADVMTKIVSSAQDKRLTIRFYNDVDLPLSVILFFTRFMFYGPLVILTLYSVKKMVIFTSLKWIHFLGEYRS